MSPSRARSRRAPLKRERSRREIATALGAVVAIVGGTALAIWLLRPGDPLVPGTGGLAHRQPRATWLVAGSVLAAVVAVVFILRSRKWRRRAKAAIPAALAIILVVAIAVGVMWPGALLRTYVPIPEAPDLPPPSITAPAETSAPGQTTAPGQSTVPGRTTAPGATTAPVGTTPATNATVPTVPPTTGGSP
jgi:hypothetical protein